MKWLKLAAASALVLAAGVYTAIRLGDREVVQLQQKVDALEQERRRLLDYVRRLSAWRRVAQVDVIKQRRNERGQTVTTLLWQEIAADGTLGRPVALEAVGDLVYVEALVIKFAHELVGEGDPERGASVALFRRVFGDQQAPESVPEIDRAARPPGDAGRDGQLLAELWARFWDLVENPELAARYGVRVAQCEAPAVRMQLSQIWEVTLDSAGGINLKLLTEDRSGLPGGRG